MTQGTRRRRTGVALGLMACALLVAALPSTSNAAGAHIYTVPGSIYSGFVPRFDVVLHAGAPLTYQNFDVFNHNLMSTSGLFGSQFMVGFRGTSAVAGVENLRPGNYPFVCTFHPLMKGTLIVRP